MYLKFIFTCPTTMNMIRNPCLVLNLATDLHIFTPRLHVPVYTVGVFVPTVLQWRQYPEKLMSHLTVKKTYQLNCNLRRKSRQSPELSYVMNKWIARLCGINKEMHVYISLSTNMDFRTNESLGDSVLTEKRELDYLWYNLTCVWAHLQRRN